MEFVVDDGQESDVKKEKSFTIVSRNSGFTEYTIALSGVVRRTGTLKQIRFYPSASSSGFVAIDSIAIPAP